MDEKQIKIKIYEFDKPDRDGDIILSKGVSINKDIPVLWNFDVDKPPLCVLKKEEAVKLCNGLFGEYTMAPGGVIKKCRKPNRKELKENPKLKRIIEKMEIIELSLIPNEILS